MKKDSVKPDRILYVISVLIFLCGMALFAYLLMTGISSTVSKIDTRVVMPGTETIEFTETGKYTIYFEQRSNMYGKIYETNDINGLTLSLRNIETGEELELINTAFESSYNVGSRKGKSIFNFKVEKAGKYEIRGWYESDKDQKVVLAIGKGFVTALVRTILLCIVTFFASVGVSVIIFIYTFNKRKRNRILNEMHNSILNTQQSVEGDKNQ
ncbi:MAG TPA: hypothetical protein GXX36_00225 [Clostridiaceae bacterium]|nr:hypothetical protein [Clostridiaceae bacterium]